SQPNLCFLRLVGDTSGVHSIQSEIIVISAVAGKSHAPLVGGARIDGSSDQREHRRPVAAVQGESLDLNLLNAASERAGLLVDLAQARRDRNLVGTISDR